MELSVILHLASLALGLFGGAAALENTLENYVINQPWLPTWAKGLVVPLITFTGGIIASILGGVAPATAFQLALAAWGATVAIHNHPSTTSAQDPMLPPPPADANGIPGMGIPQGPATPALPSPATLAAQAAILPISK